MKLFYKKHKVWVCHVLVLKMPANTVYNFILYKVDEYSESIKEQEIQVFDIMSL